MSGGRPRPGSGTSAASASQRVASPAVAGAPQPQRRLLTSRAPRKGSSSASSSEGGSCNSRDGSLSPGEAPWDSGDDAASQGSGAGDEELELELATLEAELGQRHEQLQSIQVQETELRSKLQASVRDAEDMLRNVESMQARIEDSANEATMLTTARGGYWTPRQPSGAQAPSRQPALADLVGRWASEPLGLAATTNPAASLAPAPLALPRSTVATDSASETSADAETRRMRMAMGLES